MVRLKTVKVNREKQVRRRLEEVQFFLEQERVGAQRDEFPARDDAFDDLADLLVDERLAAGNRYHRRTTFVDRVEAFLHG